MCPSLPRYRERLLERTECNPWAVPRESEAGLVSFSVNCLADDHLKMAFILPVSAADVASIKPNNDGFGRPRRYRLRRSRGVRQDDRLTETRIVLFRTVPAFAAPLTGSSSDSKSATLPNGASAAYRAVT